MVAAAGSQQEQKAELVNLTIAETERFLEEMKAGRVAGVALAAVMEDGSRYYGASDLVKHSEGIGTELAFGIARLTR